MPTLKKKSLVGYADTSWIKHFKWNMMNPNAKKEHQWIGRLNWGCLSFPRVSRSQKPEGSIHPYPSSDRQKKVRITIEEI